MTNEADQASIQKQQPGTQNFLGGLMSGNRSADASAISMPEVPTTYVKPTLGGYAHLVWEEPSKKASQQGDDRPKIYLGSAEVAMKQVVPYKTLKSANIKGVVNCTKEIRCEHREQGIKYAQVAINDVPGADLITYLPGATAFVHACLTGPMQASVLVHCMAGMSRSASVVLAYLIEHHHMSLDEAYTTVKQKRPLICPNEGFWVQLMAYEKRCRLREQQRKQAAEQEEGQPSSSPLVPASAAPANDAKNKIDSYWAQRSSAMYATCRDMTMPGNSFIDGCFGRLLHASSEESSDETVLNIVLDYIWGRGVLQVEVDWLAEVCRILDQRRQQQQGSNNQNDEDNVGQSALIVETILTNPESQFCSDWVCEIYPHQLGRVFTTLQIGQQEEE